MPSRLAHAPEPSARRLRGLIRRFAKQRILVVGDLMLDEFIWGQVERISPEAPVPVVRVTRESVHLGGAANVVHNVRALGGQAAAAGIVGRDAAGRRVVQELRRIGAGTTAVAARPGVVTARKTRVIAHNQQVVRFDREAADHDPQARRRLLRLLQRHLGDFDAVIVSDYGKGVIDATVMAALRAARTRRPFRLIVDPKKPNYDHYAGVTMATPNLTEAADAAAIAARSADDLPRIGRRLLERWDAEAILITRGEHGMTLCTRRGEVRHFPTAARQVFDVTGAGDTVVATCALAVAAGASFAEAAWLANHAAGVVVAKVGTATAAPEELIDALLHGLQR